MRATDGTRKAGGSRPRRRNRAGNSRRDSRGETSGPRHRGRPDRSCRRRRDRPARAARAAVPLAFAGIFRPRIAARTHQRLRGDRGAAGRAGPVTAEFAAIVEGGIIGAVARRRRRRRNRGTARSPHFPLAQILLIRTQIIHQRGRSPNGDQKAIGLAIAELHEWRAVHRLERPVRFVGVGRG